MARLASNEVDSHDAVVTAWLAKNRADKPVLKVYKSVNRHALTQTYKPGRSELNMEWILCHKDNQNKDVFTGEEVNMVQSLILGADLETCSQGLLVKLRAPVSIDKALQLVQDEDGAPMVISEVNGRTVLVEMIQVCLDDKAHTKIVAKGLAMDTGETIHYENEVDLSAIPFD